MPLRQCSVQCNQCKQVLGRNDLYLRWYFSYNIFIFSCICCHHHHGQHHHHHQMWLLRLCTTVATTQLLFSSSVMSKLGMSLTLRLAQLLSSTIHILIILIIIIHYHPHYHQQLGTYLTPRVVWLFHHHHHPYYYHIVDTFKSSLSLKKFSITTREIVIVIIVITCWNDKHNSRAGRSRRSSTAGHWETGLKGGEIPSWW